MLQPPCTAFSPLSARRVAAVLSAGGQTPAPVPPDVRDVASMSVVASAVALSPGFVSALEDLPDTHRVRMPLDPDAAAVGRGVFADAGLAWPLDGLDLRGAALVVADATRLRASWTTAMYPGTITFDGEQVEGFGGHVTGRVATTRSTEWVAVPMAGDIHLVACKAAYPRRGFLPELDPRHVHHVLSQDPRPLVFECPVFGGTSHHACNGYGLGSHDLAAELRPVLHRSLDHVFDGAFVSRAAQTCTVRLDHEGARSEARTVATVVGSSRPRLFRLDTPFRFWVVSGDADGFQTVVRGDVGERLREDDDARGR